MGTSVSVSLSRLDQWKAAAEAALNLVPHAKALDEENRQALVRSLADEIGFAFESPATTARLKTGRPGPKPRILQETFLAGVARQLQMAGLTPKDWQGYGDSEKSELREFCANLLRSVGIKAAFSYRQVKAAKKIEFNP